MAAPLTPNACRDLADDSNHVVLVSCPTLRIADLATFPETDLCGFRKKHVAELTDGTHTVRVVLPADFKLHEYGRDRSVQQPELTTDDVITIQRMLRLYDGNKSVILVHAVERLSDDAHMTLQTSDLEQRIIELEDEVVELRRSLANMLELDPMARATLVGSTTTLADEFNNIVEESLMSPADG